MPLRCLTAGESHGPSLAAILEGIPAGLSIDEKTIRQDLARRQLAAGAGGRMAIETDYAEILAGVMEGKTTGAPIALRIANRDFAKWKGHEVPAYTTPRPGHADLAALLKYGYDDIRPSLERASARETASRVAIGAICRAFLKHFGIEIEGCVRQLGGIRSNAPARRNDFPTQMPDAQSDSLALKEIDKAKTAGETLGGIIEVVATGVPVGLGSHVAAAKKLDARIAAAVLSIQAIKGVEIGDAFANATLPGTQVHDAIIKADDGRLSRATNRCGGIEGGISNGMPVWFRAAMKPIPTTLAPQKTVDLATGETGGTHYERSDFCPVPRAVVVLESALAFVLADALCEKLGGDSLAEMAPRFQSLPKNAPALAGGTHVFWQ